MQMKNQISKRKFLKQGIAVIGGCALFDFGYGTEFLFSHLGEGNLNDGEKWLADAMFFVHTPKGIKCQICPNECKIESGATGECHTRTVIDNMLYTTAYGNPCAIHIDPVEKKPLFHFLPGSRAYSIAIAGCNLACLNCQNWEISQTGPQNTRNSDLMPEKLISECQSSGCNSIAYTYSDPVAFYEYTLDSSKLAREKGIKNIIVSAGYIHEKPLLEWCKFVDAANIDLKSFSNEIYEMLNAGKLQPVLDTLTILKEQNIWLEITNLVIPDWTDDFKMIEEMTGWLVENGFSDYPLHFSRFYPQYKLTNLPPTPVNTLVKARDTALKSGMKFVYVGNVPGIDAANTFCPACGQKVIERKGYTITAKNMIEGRCTSCNQIIPGVW